MPQALALNTGPGDAGNVAAATWNRYSYARDHGHLAFVEKADICNDFFRGRQWREEDLVDLRLAGRPALTINKIKPTTSNLMGEQIQNRAEIAFRPKDGAPAATAETLTKLFKHIGQVQQLDWLRSDLFGSGIITGRGFMDIRMNFERSISGDIEMSLLSSKNVLIDPDAETYDPDTWNEVFVTKWVTLDDIELLYGKDKADLLRGREGSSFAFGYDSIDRVRDRFGERYGYAYSGNFVQSNVKRNIRLIERQHKLLTRQKFLVDPKTGDMRVIPEEWDRNRIAQVSQQYNLGVINKVAKRIRWDVIADSEEMHSDWSPYNHFTPVPYFPYFIHGHTMGVVEDLCDPQELLNKTLSQELHVVNSSANGGWKIKTGNLRNMSLEELEQKGAMTGLVLELDEMDGAEKITPNNTPQGLDRLSYKAEEHIKGISNVSDSMQGQDRADVAAKAIQAKQKAGITAHAKPLDSLVRTDYFIARAVLDLMQQFYTEARIITITHDQVQGTTEDLQINQVQPDGTILNDLTMGEYEVVISSVPARETLEDSQFDQAVALKQLGVAIDDQVLIESSRLLHKGDILKAMQAKANSPEAQAQRALNIRQQTAEIDKLEAEVEALKADAALKLARTDKDTVAMHRDAHTPIEDPNQPDAQAGMPPPPTPLEVADQEHRHNLERDQFAHQQQIDHGKLAIERDKAQAVQVQAAAKAESEQVAAQQKIAADMVARRASQGHQSPENSQPQFSQPE